MKNAIAAIIDCIKKHKKFMITSHIDLEGDAVGSEIAFYRLLKKLDKDANIVNAEPIPKQFDFLHEAGPIVNTPKDFDVAVVLDCPTLARTGKVEAKIAKSKKLILNIDHHVSNDRFGDMNWVDKDASSCGEMIYHLFGQMRVPIEKDEAMALYVAILTDTGSFRHANTAPITHRIAGELLEIGVDGQKVINRIYENFSLGRLKLLGRVLSAAELNLDGKVVSFTANQKMFDETKTTLRDTEDFINFGKALEGIFVAVLFKEEKGRIHVSFRSRGETDVNKVAAEFGGGGHKNASGCTIEGSLDKAKHEVLKKIEEYLKDGRKIKR